MRHPSTTRPCPPLHPLEADEGQLRHAAEVLKAMAHPLRLRIVAALCQGERHVNALAERLGVSQPLLSQQLRILRLKGLVSAERRGGLAVYRLQEEGLRRLLGCLVDCGR